MHIPSQNFLKLRKWYYYYYYHLPWNVRLLDFILTEKGINFTSMFINFYPLNPNLNFLAVIRRKCLKF